MSIRPLTIEFTGLPNAGKTTLIHNLQKSLSAKGFSVKVMQEDAELVPSVIPKLTWVRNVWITFGQLQTLLECNYSDCDIILLDRGYYDALFWAKFLYLQKVCTQSESETIINILDMTNSSFKLKPDFLFVIDVSVYKCQYINEQKIQNKNVQKCKLCNLRRFIFYFFYFIFYSIGSACNINNMRMMQ